jgi:hypothetical protein
VAALVRFLRVLGDSLRWDNDRIALTLFARIAAPQVRLTKDPNTFFFFLDNLQEKSPFPIEGRHELGHEHRARHLLGHAGHREGRGAARQVEERADLPVDLRRPGLERHRRAIAKLARDRNIPVLVLGVGTLSGGIIPEPPRPQLPPLTTASAQLTPPQPRVHSVLDVARR